MLSEELIILRNTLSIIETKGENTKLMAQCLVYTENLIAETQKAEKVLSEKNTEKSDNSKEEQ